MTIGKFTIEDSAINPEKVWIERDNGEGSEFDRQELEEVIDKFYKDNF